MKNFGDYNIWTFHLSEVIKNFTSSVLLLFNPGVGTKEFTAFLQIIHDIPYRVEVNGMAMHLSNYRLNFKY